MKVRTILLFASLILILAFGAFDYVVYAEERKVLSRNYVGLGVEVYAPYQCYPSDIITIRIRVEALEDVKNASVTVFIWSSKSEGNNPWGTSYTVLDVTDFPNGTAKEETYNITIPSDIDPGLTYGILSLDWSIHQTTSWESQWDKASFRATYVKNRDYEDLQDKYDSTKDQMQSTQMLMYTFLTTTVALAISTVYFVKKKSKPKRTARA